MNTFQWINVKNCLPEINKRVLVCIDKECAALRYIPTMHIAYYDGEHWRLNTNTLLTQYTGKNGVMFWTELPEEPEL